MVEIPFNSDISIFCVLAVSVSWKYSENIKYQHKLHNMAKEETENDVFCSEGHWLEMAI